MLASSIEDFFRNYSVREASERIIADIQKELKPFHDDKEIRSFSSDEKAFFIELEEMIDIMEGLTDRRNLRTEDFQGIYYTFNDMAVILDKYNKVGELLESSKNKINKHIYNTLKLQMIASEMILETMFSWVSDEDKEEAINALELRVEESNITLDDIYKGIEGEKA